MWADCSITCGSWGQGLAAFDRLAHMLPWVTLAACVIGIVWLISEVRK